MGIFNRSKKPKLKVIEKLSDEREGDRAILKQLAALGDNHSNVRPVRHYFYFETVEGLELFLNHSRISGAEKEQTASGIGIIVILESSMEEKDILAQVDEVRLLATNYGGEYDGWETMVVV